MSNVSFASATSLKSSPYENLLSDAECITAVDRGSWLAIASNRANLGNVDAILVERKRKLVVQCNGEKRADWRKRDEVALLAQNIAEKGREIWGYVGGNLESVERKDRGLDA